MTPTPAATAVVRSQNINVRGGPGTVFGVVGTAPEGRALAVVGRNADRSWWQVCCVNGQPVWVSASVVTIRGDEEAVPVVSPLLPDDLSASWALHWECYAEGCPQPECQGESTAQALQVRNERWLEVKREATWPDKCGQKEDWLVQVDRYTGQEAQTSAPPLFYVWAGANPGPENRSIELLDRTLSLWCTDTRTREVPQSGGWTVLYEGNACYDRVSGLLVTMEYTKRWLYTGTSGGQTYDRQYFGDYEVYQQILTDTNMPLSGE